MKRRFLPDKRSGLRPPRPIVCAFALWATLFGPGIAHADDSSSGNYEVTIPLSNDGLPASDLVYPIPSRALILNPQEAWNLKKKSKLDLSTLDPDATNDLWKNESTQQDDALDDTLQIQSGDTVTFLGFIGSSPGRFKFNVQVRSQFGPPRTLTLMLSRDLHTTLLRKGLLRRLGYKIPPMKYLSTINVVLPDAETHDKLFPAAIGNSALGAAKRWQIPSPLNASPLTFSLQDVVAMEATPLYYNVALGPPIEQIAGTNQIRPAGPRIIRALGPIYGLAYIPENIQQSSWYVGRVEDATLVIDVADRANFACTLDDAIWATRRIAKLTREDFEDAVEKAHYPDFVAKLVVENLISRRNSLLNNIRVKASNLSFDPNISYGSELVNGKLVLKDGHDWQALGYASNFSGTEPQSPLKDIWWYVASQLQSNVTANLLQKLNDKLPQLSVNDAFNQHVESLYKDDSNQIIRFGSWTAPIASGGVDISRDIVIGSYMGTTGDNGSSNIVQLADNFGFHVSAGLIIGFDGLPTNPIPLFLQGQVMGSASIAVTHLKPVTNLKTAVKEPLKNEFVPWIFYNASNILENASNSKDGKAQTPDELKAKIAENLEALKKFVGVGESLILTESMSLNENLQLGAQVPSSSPNTSPSVSVQPSANQVLLWRLRVYRPQNNPNMLFVYKDNGALKGVQVSLNLSVGAQASFPVAQLTAKGVSGTADTEYYRLNVTPDPQKNPQLFANSAALAVALRGGSIESLREIQKPTLISTRFRDFSDSIQFLYYVNRSLKTNGLVTVSLPNGASDSFISLSDGKQKGGNYQSFATQIVNFLIQKLSPGRDINIDTKASQNPGQTYKGYSSTRDASLQARAGERASELFGKVQYRWEGWDISSPDAQALASSLGQKYGFTLYPEGFLHDTRNVQLYSITLSIYFYESALRNILSLKPSDAQSLAKKYKIIHECYPKPPRAAVTTPPDMSKCEAITRFESGYARYQKGIANSSDEATSVLKIFSGLEHFASFKDLVTLTGGVDSTGQPKNIYLQSMLSGFREGSENLSQPILSSTFGHVNPDQTGGPLDSAQQILGIDDGEFEAQWLRDHL